MFHYLSNSVEQQTGIEISGIRPEIRYPVFRMAGYPAKLLSGPSLVKTILQEREYMFYIFQS